MRSFTQLFVAATVFTGVLAQYFDGYETVNLPTDPVQIRLAYQGPSAMMVSWNTFEQLSNPTVTYGTDPNNLALSASSSVSITYQTSLTYNNHVNITGLSPFTTYYYLPQYSNATTPYSFTTARAAGDMTPFNVAVVVDMGTFGPLGLSTTVGAGAANPLRPGEQTTITALTQVIDTYEFLVHAGDISYADAWLKEEIGNYLATTTTAQGAQVYESILNAFYDELEQVTASKPYMVNPGNHEANCDNGGTTNKTSGEKYTESICMVGQTNFTGYINHFRMPSGPSGGLGNMWYSYDYGMVHFVHIDTETDLGNGVPGPDEGSTEFGGPFGTYNQQIDWFTNDLASVNRTLTPWVVVFGHRGWYLSSTTNPTVQTAFENLFYQYGVDVYVNGHAHLYERTVPIYNNVIDPNGLNNPSATLYLTNGAAGHYDGLDTFGAIEPYSAYHTVADYSWATLNFINSTYMSINGLWSANNTVFDTALLYKAHTAVVSTSTSSSSMSSTSSIAQSSSSVPPTTTTSSATTTTSGVVGPTYTNFSGLGHLLIYLMGVHQGDIGSAGTWYNAIGQSVATYTAVPLNPGGASFTLQHSSSYCTIGSADSSFGCAANAAGATIFGQTPDGNLTYQGSELFYASTLPGGTTPVGAAKPTVYATALAYTLNVVWSPEATVVSSTSSSLSSVSTSSSVTVTTSSSSSVVTSSSSGVSQTSSSSSSQVTSSSSVSQTSSSSSSQVTSSSSVPPTSSSSSSQVSSSSSVSQSSSSSSSPVSASVITVTTTQSGIPTTIISTVDLLFTNTLTTSVPYTTTATDDFSFSFTQTTTATADFSFTNTLTTLIPYTTTAVSTETDDFSFSFTQTTTATDDLSFTNTLTTSIPYTTTAVSTETDGFSFTNTQTTSVPYTTTATETDDFSFSFTQTTTATDDLSFTNTQTTSIPYTTTATDDFSFSFTTTAVSVSTATDDLSFTTSIPYTTTATDDLSFTNTLTTSVLETTTAVSTLTDDISFTTSIVQTTTAVSILTDDISFTTSVLYTTTALSVQTDVISYTKTTTQDIPTTVLSVSIEIETDSVTFTKTATLPASTIISTRPASTYTYTQSGSIRTVTLPASTFTTTKSASASIQTVTKPGSVVTTTRPASTFTLTEPVSTVTKSASVKTVTQQASTYTLTEPVVTVTKPASTSIKTVTQQASTHTLTEPIVTVTKPASTFTKSGSIVTVTKLGTTTSIKPASTVTLLEIETKTTTSKVGSQTVTKTVTATKTVA